MKTPVYILLLLYIFLSCSEGNQKSRTDSDVQDSLITDTIHGKNTHKEHHNIDALGIIKKDYQILQGKLAQNKLDSTKVSYENDETSGDIVFYRENDTLKVIRHRYAEHSHFSSEENYYIKNDSLFFVYLQEAVWSFDGGTPEKPQTKDQILEKRIYFDQNNPISCLEKKYTIRSSDSANPDPKNIPSKEVKCNVDEIIKTYHTLLKNSDMKGKINSL